MQAFKCKLCGNDREQAPGTGYSNLKHPGRRGWTSLNAPSLVPSTPTVSCPRGSRAPLDMLSRRTEPPAVRSERPHHAVHHQAASDVLQDPQARNRRKWRKSGRAACERERWATSPVSSSMAGRLAQFTLLLSSLSTSSMVMCAVSCLRSLRLTKYKRVEMVLFLVGDNCNTS